MYAGRRNRLIVMALLACGLAAAASRAQDQGEAPRRVTLETPPAASAPQIPACASDPSKLGLERIVEIDNAGGSVFGNAQPHNNFLNDHEVVLTFDDGPLRAYTHRVLKALDDQCTRATFFMVGRMAAGDPTTVKEVIAAGHTVGSHTYSHKNLRPLGFIKGRAEFELGLSAVTKAAGQPVAPFFRFPYLSESRQVLGYLQSRNIATFFIDIDSKDYQTRNSDLVFNRIMTQLNTLGKGIILMHDIQPSTAGMIARLLDTLHQKGYKVVHMVPKETATTVAGFDGAAGKELAANSDKLKQQPLADRSVVWTMAPPAKPSASTAAKPAAPNAGPASTQAKSNEDLPWKQQQTTTTKSSPGTQVTRRPQRRDEELPWQAKIFSN